MEDVVMRDYTYLGLIKSIKGEGLLNNHFLLRSKYSSIKGYPEGDHKEYYSWLVIGTQHIIDDKYSWRDFILLESEKYKTAKDVIGGYVFFQDDNTDDLYYYLIETSST